MSVKLGMVQPMSYRGEDEHGNVELALGYIEKAAEQGVDVCCFPEGYPGPFTGPRDYDPVEPMQAKAAEEGVLTVFGAFEETPEGIYTTQYVVGTDGELIGKYRRVMSAGVSFYTDIIEVPYENMAWGDQLPVFETEFGTIGISVCSEVFCPELSRVLALKGADMILYPSGWVTWTLTKAWRHLAQARAMENLVYTGLNSHRYGIEDLIGAINSPEDRLAEKDDDGILTADLDLERLAWLRTNVETGKREEYKVMPGLSSGLKFHDHEGTPLSRRPEMYEPITMSEGELDELR